MSILPLDFFDRPTVDVAHDLIGKFLIREYNGHPWVLMITEVEIHDNQTNKTPHIIGTLSIHALTEEDWILGVVTGPKDSPAILHIRSALIMMPTGELEHIDEPTKLTAFLKIDAIANGSPAMPEHGIWFEDRDIAIPHKTIIKKKRTNRSTTEERDDTPHNFSIPIEKSASHKNS